jgi:hypothetical protein
MYIAKAQRVREKTQVFQKQQFGLKLLYVRRLVWSTFWSRAPFCCLVSAGPMLQWLAPRVVYFVFDFRTCDLGLSFFVQKGSFGALFDPGRRFAVWSTRGPCCNGLRGESAKRFAWLSVFGRMPRAVWAPSRKRA